MLTSFDPEKIWKTFYEQQSTGSSRCYVVKLSDKAQAPALKKLRDLPFPYNSAYVRHQKKLYYINQTDRLCEEVKVSDETLTLFDQQLRPHHRAKPIPQDEFQKIISLIEHTPPSEEKRLEWYKLRLTKKRHEKFGKALTGKMSSDRIKTLLELQKKWKQKKQSPVNPRGNHSEEFDELVHGQTIQKSIDAEKLKQLETALNSGDRVDWDNPIFKDETLAELALTLLGQEKTASKELKTVPWQKNKISYHQAVTLLERVQTLKQHTYKNTYPILDEKGQFTSRAKEFLLPKLNEIFLEGLPDEQIEKFRLLIASLPLSEQMYYEVDATRYINRKFYSATLLGEYLIEYNVAPYNHSTRSIMMLSAGVRDALGLAKFKQDYVPMRPTLGDKTPLEIDEGLRWSHKKRFGALDYKGTKAYTEVHGFVKSGPFTFLEASLHDVFHSLRMSTIPIDLQNAILYLVDVIREFIADDVASSLTAEIWYWIDCDLHRLIKNYNQLTPSEIADHFCHLLMYRNEYLIIKLFMGKISLNLCGAILLLSTIKNKEHWQRFQIDFDALPLSNPFYSYYQDTKKIYDHLKDDPPKIQLVKVWLYQFFKNKPNGEDQFKRISQLISSHQGLMLEKFKVQKITKGLIKKSNWLKHLENQLILAYDNYIFNTHSLKFFLEDLATAEGHKNPSDYSHCILNLHYTDEEINRYITHREAQKTRLEAAYLTKPSVWTWVKCHKLLSLLVLPIFYGWYQAVQLKKSYVAHLSEKTSIIKHIVLPVQTPTEPAPMERSASSAKGPLLVSEASEQGSNDDTLKGPTFASLDTRSKRLNQ